MTLLVKGEPRIGQHDLDAERGRTFNLHRAPIAVKPVTAAIDPSAAHACTGDRQTRELSTDNTGRPERVESPPTGYVPQLVPVRPMNSFFDGFQIARPKLFSFWPKVSFWPCWNSTSSDAAIFVLRARYVRARCACACMYVCACARVCAKKYPDVWMEDLLRSQKLKSTEISCSIRYQFYDPIYVSLISIKYKNKQIIL